MKIIEEMIRSKNPTSINEAKQIIRELIQQIILVGLSRSGFFNYASFYGGTALRIFYDLSRYSEDLDFTLNEVNPNFSITPFIAQIKQVATSYGLNLDISTKEKRSETPIESAFAKASTYQTFINAHVDGNLIKSLHKDELIKVKFEIDCQPALGFNIESKWLDNPEFANVAVLDCPSLFADKIHAILCRNYKNTVKGRDYYDFLFYCKKGIKPNLVYLRNKLIDSHKINEKDIFNIELVKKMLKEKIADVNFNQIKEDASKFVLLKEDLSYYCKDLFFQMIDKL